MQESLRIVEKTRPARLKKALSGEKVFTPMTDAERRNLWRSSKTDTEADQQSSPVSTADQALA